MFYVQHVKGLEQHATHPLMLDIQHVISLEQHIELLDPLPLTRDEKDHNNYNLLGFVQTISTKVSNSICSTPHPRSYSFYSYEPRKPAYLIFMSIHSKIYDSTESFACRVHNLHIEVIKHI